MDAKQESLSGSVVFTSLSPYLFDFHFVILSRSRYPNTTNTAAFASVPLADSSRPVAPHILGQANEPLSVK